MVYAIFIDIKLVQTINIYRELNMYLKTKSGKILFEGRFHTVKQAVEVAVKENISLDGVNLRQANLVGAELDNVSLNKACLWGANLTRANMTGAQLHGSDCRNANIKDCCLAESDCSGVDFRGSYFSNTIFREANLENTIFSCLSLFNQNLTEIKSLENAIYVHKGEVDCDLSSVPITILGLPKIIILMKEKILIGNFLYDINFYSDFFSSFLKFIDQEKLLKFKTLK